MSTIEVPDFLGDRWWRLRNLYVIRGKDKKLHTLNFNPSQQRIIDSIRSRVESGQPVRHMDLKARQVGATTFWAMYYLDETIFTPNVITFIVSQKHETNGFIWDAVRLAYENMPESLRPRTREESAKTLAFEGLNSKISVALRVQGSMINNLHISEYALCDQEKVEQTIAACSPSANITFETVGNGSNHAKDKWRQSGDGFTRLFHPWFLQTEYRQDVPEKLVRTPIEVKLTEMARRQYGVELDDEQIQYRRTIRSNLRQLAAQEMAEDPITCFLSSGETFFNGLKMDTLLEEARQELEKNPPIKQTEELSVWETPQHKHVYAAGADIAGGRDGDYSVLAILCVTCRRTAMRYRARCGTDFFYRYCYSNGIEYKNALLAPESNGLGLAVVQGLREIGYPNLYRESAKTRVGNLNLLKEDLKFGWDTNVDSKRVMLDNLRIALEGKFEEDETCFRPEFTVLDTYLLEETLNIRSEGGKIQAVQGKHDDVVMAYAIAFQMYKICRSSNLDLDLWRIGGQRESAVG